MNDRLGFIGIGMMGLPMAMNLLKAGYEVTVWNRSPEKAETLVEAGATRVATPAELAVRSDVVMMCLSNASAVEEVVFGYEGIASVRGPTLLIDFSSIDPALTKKYGERLRAVNDMGWLDAPVSGGTPAASSGQLTIMAGGADADFTTARPFMAPIASQLTHMGPAGAGQMTKLVNQIISGGIMALTAEAVNFAKAKGIDATKLTEALAGGFADSKPFQLLAPRMALENFENPLGTVAMMLKDLDTVASVADGKVALPMTDQVRALLGKAIEMGHAENDISTIILPLKS